VNYKIVVSYDGTDFSGWQYQPHAASVAQTLQDSFKALFGTSIKIVGASRTDAGVHAFGQVAIFSTDLDLEPVRMQRAWNDALPKTILVRDLVPAPLGFHPMYGVKEKTYGYHFFLKRPLPFVAPYGWFFRYPLDRAKLEQSLALFVGTHDFRSFCTGTEMGENTVRTINSIRLEHLQRYGIWRIEFKGPGFMRHMIRRIVGACMQTAAKPELSPDYLREVLALRDPRQELLNAPAQGLCLYKIRYHQLHEREQDAVCD
jgi:tRNA pseudouridine38-40 synthase